eukprot:scaffold714_cov121-Isochrysis_galbana.AAC.5
MALGHCIRLLQFALGSTDSGLRVGLVIQRGLESYVCPCEFLLEATDSPRECLLLTNESHQPLLEPGSRNGVEQAAAGRLIALDRQVLASICRISRRTRSFHADGERRIVDCVQFILPKSHPASVARRAEQHGARCSSGSRLFPRACVMDRWRVWRGRGEGERGEGDVLYASSARFGAAVSPRPAAFLNDFVCVLRPSSFLADIRSIHHPFAELINDQSLIYYNY